MWCGGLSDIYIYINIFFFFFWGGGGGVNGSEKSQPRGLLGATNFATWDSHALFL